MKDKEIAIGKMNNVRRLTLEGKMINKQSPLIGALIFIAINIFILPCIGAEHRSVLLTGTEGKNFLKQCSRITPEHVTGFWIPSNRDIQVLESKFSEWAKGRLSPNNKTPLLNYYRQYVGYLYGSKKYIYINAFSGIDDVVAKSWHNKAIIICDGGDYIFGLEYDVEKREFKNLLFNGEA